MFELAQRRSSKVPEVVLTFWVIKIAATTLGETGGDTLSMSMNLGYALSSFIFFAVFLVFVAAQLRAKAFHPWLYWAAIVATTLVGTTMADFADRSMGIGYFGGSALLFALVLLVLAVWRISAGSVSVNNITSMKNEAFYWATILASNTLGTALGDLVSDGLNIGFTGGVLVFTVALMVIAAAYFFTQASHAVLFWAAFILTRPLGATLGDLLTKPVSHGGFNLSRPESSGFIAIFMVACIYFIPQRAGGHPGERAQNPA
jgi:uncharacterized membrane-anchored protein